MTVSTNELCKVRDSAVGGVGKGYSYAIVKRVNKKSVRLCVIDPKTLLLQPETKVPNETLWKLKAATRKAMERKIAAKKTQEIITPGPVELEATEVNLRLKWQYDSQQTTTCFKKGLDISKEFTIGSTILNIVEGSVLAFTGDAIVNAANEGCVSGGGIDGAINDAGGHVVLEARKALPIIDDDGGVGGFYTKRCSTGDAKVTVSGNLPCDWIIHAVGPAFNRFDSETEAIELLKDAYKHSLLRAKELKLKQVAFCIISGGIFRGACPLAKVILTALYAIAKNVYPGLEEVFFCAFTSFECNVLREVTTAIDGHLTIADPALGQT